MITMTTTESGYTVQTVGTRNWNIVDPDGNVVTDADGTPVRYRSKGEALAEIEATLADLAAAAQAAEAVPVPTDRAARLKQAKAERLAVIAWRESGEQGPKPPTPCMDAIDDETVNGKPKAKSTSRSATLAAVRTPAQNAEFAAIVTTMRGDGKRWSEISAALEAAGIPRSASKRTDWTSGWIKAVAARQGVKVA